jgi:glycosyltransferase involved in cell wall biosynthesis
VTVGIVTTSYPREPGDPAGSFVAGHAAWLASRGDDVVVVAAGPGASGRQPGVTRGSITIVRIPGRRLFYTGGAPERLAAVGSWPGAVAFSLRMAAAVTRAARSWDLAIAHWFVPSAACAALCVPRHVPLTAIAHSGDVHLVRRLGGTSAIAALLASRGARLCFVSESVRDAFASAIAPRSLARRALAGSTVCAMGIDAARFCLPREREQPPVVLFLGRLVDIKGPQVLADAAERMTEPARVVVAGDGPLRRHLELRARRSSGRLSVIGEVRGRERDRWLARASVVVLPSLELADGRTEGLPVTALEAMAASVPVVAADVGGLRELPIAAHVPPRDPGALAAAIDRLLREPSPDVSCALALALRHDWSHVGPRLL